MNRAVWVYRIPVNEMTASFTNVFEIPVGARLVHLAEQHGQIAMWWEVDSDASTQQHRFQIFGTGHGPIREGLEYRGTCLFAGGDLVLHLYEVVDVTLEGETTASHALSR